MSETASSLLIVRIKQEEVTNEKGLVSRRYKRRCSLPLRYRESGPSNSDYSSSGDEWQPPTSPTSSTLSNEVKTPNLSPSTVANLPTNESMATKNVFFSVDISTTGVVIAPNTSVVPIPKSEKEYSSVEKYSDDLEGQRHPNLPAYTCDVCYKAFTQNSSLKRHVNCVHKGLRPYICEICGRNFGERKKLKLHINRDHKMLLEYVCDFCGKAFADKGSMNKHAKFVHEGLRPYPCKVCGRNFKDITHLERHIDTVHRNLREHSCEFCDKAFATTHGLKVHVLRIHQNLREHSCAFCAKAFATRTGLRLHVQGVHQIITSDKGMREHGCELCDKVFVTKQRLSRHVVRVHQNLREHSCGFCDKAFATSHDLKLHVLRIHQDRREYVCGSCGKAFNTNKDLKGHITRVHRSMSDDSTVDSHVHLPIQLVFCFSFIVHHFLTSRLPLSRSVNDCWRTHPDALYPLSCCVCPFCKTVHSYIC